MSAADLQADDGAAWGTEKQATSEPNRVRIIGDGTSARTKIEDMTTGEMMRFVTGYTLTQRKGECANAVIEVCLPAVDIECDATIVKTRKQESIPLKSAVDIVCAALRDDLEYAWSWHCNIAMAAVDAGCPHDVANEGAARFMEMLGGVDTRKHPGFAATQGKREAQLPASTCNDKRACGACFSGQGHCETQATRFLPGDRVQKVGGSYQATGVIKAAWLADDGTARYVFRFDNPAGMLHIFSDANLEPVGEVATDA